MAHRETHLSLAHDILPAAPFSRRPPSPPLQLRLQPQPQPLEDDGLFKLLPAYDNIDSSQLTADDVATITHNAPQVADSVVSEWRYEQRRDVQKVLDFLYLGPISAIRDHSFLQQEGITMLLVAQNSVMGPQKLQTVEGAAAALGIRSSYVNIASPQQLISSFPSIIRIINDHLLATDRQHALVETEGGPAGAASHPSRKGKVLVACESGNDRSAVIVAAYIMTVFGQPLQVALRFIGLKRFCTCYNDDTRRMLLSWEDILKARSQVAHVIQSSSKFGKRRVDDMLDMDGSGVNESAVDEDRFVGREEFVPFVDYS